MGATYMAMEASIMSEYEKLFSRAYEEYDRYGYVSDELDDAMKDIESTIMLLGISL